MIKCPNRNRIKFVHPGGGSLRCQGHLEIQIPVVVSAPLRLWGKHQRGRLPSWETAVPARIRKHGRRVPASVLFEQWHSVSQTGLRADVKCSDCSWSLQKLIDRVNAGAHKAKRI